MAVTLTRHCDRSAVQSHQIAHEAKANAESTLSAIETARPLHEQLEESRQQLLGNADAVVFDDDHDLLAFTIAPHAYLNAAAGIGVFRRVGQEIAEDLAETFFIAADRKFLGGHRDRDIMPTLFDAGASSFQLLFRSNIEIDPRTIELHLAAGDP